jgi:hypothetical protein
MPPPVPDFIVFAGGQTHSFAGKEAWGAFREWVESFAYQSDRYGQLAHLVKYLTAPSAAVVGDQLTAAMHDHPPRSTAAGMDAQFMLDAIRTSPGGEMTVKIGRDSA